MPSDRSQQKNKSRAARANGTWICAAVIGVATAVAFLPALQNGFVNYDDDRLLLAQSLSAAAVGGPARMDVVDDASSGHYQPLTWLSLSLDHALAGLAPFAYHLDSLLWHTAAALLFYGVLVTLLERADPIGAADARYLRVCARSRCAVLVDSSAARGVGRVGRRAARSRQHRVSAARDHRLSARRGRRTRAAAVAPLARRLVRVPAAVAVREGVGHDVLRHADRARRVAAGAPAPRHRGIHRSAVSADLDPEDSVRDARRRRSDRRLARTTS